MIKGLKKLCILGLIGLPILLANFSSATFTAHSIGAFTPSVGDSSFSVSVFSLGEVYTENGSLENFVFAPTNNLLFYRNVDSKPTLLLPNCYSDRYGGELKYYYVCDDIPDSNFTGLTNCSSFQPINDEYLAYFMGTITNNDNWAYDYHLGQYGFNLCFSSKSEGKSLCFGSQSSVYNDWCSMWQSDLTCTDGYCSYTSPFSGGEYTNLTYTFDNIPLEVVGLAPNSNSNHNVPISGGSIMSGFVYDHITSGDVVRYYEESRNFDESMCYVGTTDLTSLYEDRIPYDQGSGYTIFDTYSKLFDKSSYKLSEIAEFYSVWIDNFSNWFRGGDTHVIYTYGELPTYGNDLTNPFLNNLAVYYFIGSTFWYSHQTHYNTNGVGMSLSYYCYNKLTNVSNDGSTYNITDDHGSNIDGEVLDKKNNVNHYYSGEYEIVAQSREGTPVDYFSSGSNYTNAKDFFNANFNKFKEVLRPLSPGDLGLGYVPGYIILFMLALILFRFLGH